jgi:carboxyl-terminal processing protease
MKLRTGLLLSTAFVAGITAAPMASLVARQFGLQLFPSAFAQDGSRADTYRLLNLFSDVFERVRADYVEPVKDRDLVENAISGMLTGLDPHSSYMNAKAYQEMQEQTTGEFGGLGLEVTADSGFIKVISPIDDTPASRAGIKAGDLILALDGQSVQGMSLNEAVDKMHGATNTKIKLTLKRDGVDKPLEVALTREVIKIQVVKSHLEGNDIGYIRITSFSEQTDPGLRRAYADLQAKSGNKLKGIILDLRNNPGGLLDQAISVSDDFIKDGEIVSTRARHPEDSQRWNAHDGDITNGLPVVVLMNGGSASASEIVGGALQDHRRAIIMGTRSFGKGSVQTVIPLPGSGGAMRLTTARYYTPSGRSIQGLGIVPDIEVAATREEQPKFLPDREADLKGAISNIGGVAASSLPPRTDLPAIAKDIPKLPPVNQPAYDPTKFETDFQLQQALTVVRAMASPLHAGP